MSVEHPEKIDRYEIRRELGHGGMATVYYAYDPRVGREVAIKVLLKEFTNDPMFRQRFEREVKSVVSLEHSAIVPVYDYGDSDEQPFLVMRYMQGGTLGDRLKDGPLALEDASTIMARVGSALDQAHMRGIVHRDLKPQNILFDQYDNAFLSDFGIVKLAASSHTLTDAGGVVGTPAYMSPEQVQGDADIDGRTDIYALGVILYECLTGTVPYNADTPMGVAIKHVTEPVPRLTDVKPEIPEEVSEMIEKALAKNRDERYKTAGSFVDEMLKVTGGDLKALMASGTFVASGTGPLSAVRKTGQRDAVNPSTLSGATIGTGTETEPNKPGIKIGSMSIPLWAVAAAGVVTLLVAIGAVGLIATLASGGGSTGTPEANGGTPGSSDVLGGGGGQLVFISPVDNKSTIFTMGVDGSGIQRLVSDDNNNSQAAYSPDGTKIAYTTVQQGGKRMIVVVNIDGTNSSILSDPNSDDLMPSWSPDGTRIVFVSRRDGGPAEIYSMAADGTDAIRLTNNTWNDLNPAYSPDGTQIVYDAAKSGTGDIFVMNTDGSNLLALTDDPYGDYSPSWSPDGTKIAFVSERDGTPEIYVMDVDGTDQTRLTENDSADLSPRFSPDGTLILFVARRDGNAEVYIMDVDGGNPRRLTNQEPDDLDAAWQP